MRRILAVTLLLAGGLGGCDFEATESLRSRPSDAPSEKRASTSTRVPHTITFSGDILSGPVTVTTSASNPFANLGSPTTPLTLPVTPELLGCGETGGNWSPYAGNWTGYLVIEGGASSSTLTFWARDPDGIPFVIGFEAASTTQKIGDATVLSFTDVQVMAKKDQLPLVIIRPCASFSITARPI